MIDKTKKNLSKIRRTQRSRYRLKKNGTSPRLVFNKTNRYLIAQVVDDSKGVTLAYASTLEKSFEAQSGSRKTREAAKALGKLIAERSSANGVKQVMLDRSGMIFHGKIAAFAEAAREGGLEF